MSFSSFPLRYTLNCPLPPRRGKITLQGLASPGLFEQWCEIFFVLFESIRKDEGEKANGLTAWFAWVHVSVLFFKRVQMSIISSERRSFRGEVHWKYWITPCKDLKALKTAVNSLNFSDLELCFHYLWRWVVRTFLIISYDIAIEVCNPWGLNGLKQDTAKFRK